MYGWEAVQEGADMQALCYVVRNRNIHAARKTMTWPQERCRDTALIQMPTSKKYIKYMYM